MDGGSLSNRRGIWGAGLAALFFASVFLFFLHPVKEGDIWWHLSFGRWMWEHGALPEAEPFLYTANVPPSRMEMLLITGAWLSQTLYYGIYLKSGFAGLTFLNALTVTAIFFTVWRTMLLRGMDGTAAMALLIPGLVLMARFDEVRPHNFSLLGTVLLLYLLERGVESLRERPPGRAIGSSPLVLIPPLMLLWANLHQGVIIGAGLLALYIMEALVTRTLGRGRTLTPAGFAHFMTFALLGMGAACLNPNGPDALYRGLLNVINLSGHMGTTMELQSPLAFMRLTGGRDMIVVPAVMGALAVLLMALSWRQVTPLHVVLFLGFMATLSTVRFMIYFVSVAAVMAGLYGAPYVARMRRAALVLAAVLCLAFIPYASHRSYRNITSGAWPVIDAGMPAGAADFMAAAGLPGRVFNPFSWGGYLEWRLYPKYTFFTDPRITNYETLRLYELARSGGREEVFARYGIDTVVFHPVYFIGKEVDPLVLALLKDRRWKLVYVEPGAAVFVRRAADLKGLPEYDARALIDYLIGFGEHEAAANPDSPAGYDALGTIYFYLGEWDKARGYLDRAEALRGR